MYNSYRNTRNSMLFGCAKPNTRTANQQFRFYMASLSEVRTHFYKSREELKSIIASLSFDNTQNSEQKENALNYLWRSQIIMAYSAFDLYMHEVLYLGFYKMKNMEITESDEYKRVISEAGKNNPRTFKKNLEDRYDGMSLTSGYNWKRYFEWLDLNSEEISSLYLNGKNRKYNQGFASDTLKNDLDNNSNRRNALVHAYDYDDVLEGRQNTITSEKAGFYINFVSGIVDTIDTYINSKWN